MRFLLKILSGPNAGGEALLAPGEYVLGRSDECDFVLADAAVAPRHARLHVAADAVQVSALEAPVLVQGATIPEGRTQVRAFQVVTLGGTHLCIGPADEEWPKVSLPELVREQAPAPPGHDVPQASSLPNVPEPSHLPGAGKMPALAASASGAASKPPAKRRRFVVLALLVALAAGCLYGVLRSRRSSRDVAPTPEARAGEVVERLQRRGISCWNAVDEGARGAEASRPGRARGVAVFADTHGITAVRGVVADEGARGRVVEAVTGLAFPVVTEVKTLDEVVAAARRELEERNWRLRVNGEGYGGVRVAGFARDRTVREGVAAALSSLAPAALDIRFSLVGWELLAPALARALGRHGLERLEITPEETYLRVAGSLSPQEMRKWSLLRGQLESELGVPIAFADPALAPPPPTPAVKPMLEEQTKAAAPPPVPPPPPPPEPKTVAAQPPPLEKKTTPETQPPSPEPAEKAKPPPPDIVTVDLATPRRFQSSDGKWHEVGEQLESGFRVVEIFADGAVLTRGDETAIITRGKR